MNSCPSYAEIAEQTFSMNCGTKDCELQTFSINCGTKDCEFRLNSQSLIPQTFLPQEILPQ